MKKIKNYLEQDWIGKWYTIAKERGTNITASLGRIDLSNNNEMTWYKFSHEDMDGIGALTKWLREKGYKIPELPKQKFNDKPAWWKRPFMFLKGMTNLEPSDIRWKVKEEVKGSTGQDFPFVVLTIEETAKVKQAAKERGVGINAHLLEKLNNLVLGELAMDNVSGSWLFPVNMRGGVNKQNEYANQSSGILVKSKKHISALELQNNIKMELVNSKHWINWWAYHIGIVLGMRGMRYLSNRSSDKSFFFGTFTNMGEWPIPGSEPKDLYNPNEAYLCAPPGTKNYPISAGFMTWHGKTSISFKIHPSICPDQEKVTTLLQKYKESIL